MEEVAGGWGRLFKRSFITFYSSLNIIRAIRSKRVRRAKHLVRIGDNRYAYRTSVGKCERKRPL